MSILKDDSALFEIRVGKVRKGMHEIQVLRRLFSEQAQRSISEVKSSLGEGSVLCIRPRLMAEEIVSRARQLGIDLVLVQREELD